MNKRKVKSVLVSFGIMATLGLAPINSDGQSILLNYPQAEAAVNFEPSGYWNGDANYPRVFYRDGGKCSWYIDLSSLYIQNRADGGVSVNLYITYTVDNQFEKNAFYNIHITRNNSGYHIYQGGKGLREITGFGYEQPAYNAGLFLINYLSL